MLANIILLAPASLLAALSAFLLSGALLEQRSLEQRNQRLRTRMGLSNGAKRTVIIPGLLGHVQAKRRKEREKDTYERDIPAMLEVVAMGMRAGLSFDGAFGLYVTRFSSPLALACARTMPQWNKGIIGRDEALAHMSADIDVPFFTRFTVLVERSIRFGAPITGILTSLAEDARKEYRAVRERRIAKAPVRMLIPTAACILPAMLLLVLGPVILELTAQMA